MTTMNIRPPRWLPPGAKKIWTQIIPLIPGFDPVLDRVALTAYVNVLTHITETRSRLEQEGLHPSERHTLERLLAEWESQAQALAGDLGLTPASWLKIARKRKKGG